VTFKPEASAGFISFESRGSVNLELRGAGADNLDVPFAFDAPLSASASAIQQGFDAVVKLIALHDKDPSDVL